MPKETRESLQVTREAHGTIYIMRVREEMKTGINVICGSSKCGKIEACWDKKELVTCEQVAGQYACLAVLST